MANQNLVPVFPVLKKTNFQAALKGLDAFSKTQTAPVEISKVDTDAWIPIFDHDVTGQELNMVTSQIQKHLIAINQTTLRLTQEFGQVYKTFDYLDREYITGIVASIEAIKKVHEREQEDRENIRKSVEVLKRFKSDIEKLKHLTDVDRVWDLIQKIKAVVDETDKRCRQLLGMCHIKDVDTMWNDLDTSKKLITEAGCKLSKIEKGIVACERLEKERCESYDDKFRRINERMTQQDESVEKVIADSIKRISKDLKTQSDNFEKKVSKVSQNLSSVVEVMSRDYAGKDILEGRTKGLNRKVGVAIGVAGVSLVLAAIDLLARAFNLF